MSKIVMRLEKAKTLRDISKREMHNTRSRNVESSNDTGEVIVEGILGVAKEIDRITKQMNKQLKSDGKRAIRKDAIRCIELIVSSDSNFFKNNDYREYFNDVDEFLHQFWGEESIIHQKTIHLDESVNHAHYLLSPIKGGRFNYSKFINGRDDLSAFQQAFEDFIILKGYDIERRQLAKNTQKKHKMTREWSKEIQRAKEYVELMDKKTLIDTAISGMMLESERAIINEQLQLKDDFHKKYNYYMKKANALEERLKLIMREQNYSNDFIDYELKTCIDEFDKNIFRKESNIIDEMEKM